jgi:hypothetical protein
MQVELFLPPQPLQPSKLYHSNCVNVPLSARMECTGNDGVDKKWTVAIMNPRLFRRKRVEGGEGKEKERFIPLPRDTKSPRRSTTPWPPVREGAALLMYCG